MSPNQEALCINMSARVPRLSSVPFSRTHQSTVTHVRTRQYYSFSTYLHISTAHIRKHQYYILTLTKDHRVSCHIHELDERNTFNVGSARTIHIRCTYDIFGRDMTNYTVIYGVYKRFWPTPLTRPCRTHCM
jgi:hypothetical protein